jgi:multidrug transporter EmrE-like cation transporter
MNTPITSIIYYIIAAIIGALGQYLYKIGADKSDGSLSGYLLNAPLIGGVVCYIGVMLLFVAAYKKGGELNVLYPIYASTFIWGAIIAYAAFDIPIKPINIIGMIMLIAGMYFMGK